MSLCKYAIKTNEIIRCSIGEISVNEGDILTIKYKDDLDFTLDKAIEMVQLCRKIANGKKMRLIIHTGEFGNMPAETRDYLASKSHADHRIAVALIIKNLPHRIMAHFISLTRKKYYPSSIFSNEKDALEWLNLIYEK